MSRAHILLATAVLTTTIFVDTGASAEQPPPPQRGELVSVSLVKRLDLPATREMLRKDGYGTSEVRHPVNAYRIVYRTPGPDGRLIRASGMVALPSVVTGRLAPVLFAHGTTPSRTAAPSVGTSDSYHQSAPIAYASAGHFAVAPDYLGLGVGDGRPAYLDTATEVSASLDMIRASRAFARREGIPVAREILLAGFSQGAHTTLTVGRALQENRLPGVRVAALAPISGAYSFQDAELPAILAGEVDPKLATLYLGYLLTSWQHLHGLYDSPREIFRLPYARFVEDLYDGTRPPDEVYSRMPERPTDLFTPRGMQLLRHPSGTFAAALEHYDAACADWAPRAPMQMFYTGGDREAVPTNTLHCLADFAQEGRSVPTRDLGTRDHTGSGAAGVIASIRWFRALTRDG